MSDEYCVHTHVRTRSKTQLSKNASQTKLAVRRVPAKLADYSLGVGARRRWVERPSPSSSAHFVEGRAAIMTEKSCPRMVMQPKTRPDVEALAVTSCSPSHSKILR